MPLIVPGITNTANKTEEWSNKLVGKKVEDADHSESNFDKKDLPQTHRIIQPQQLVDRSHDPDRLNLHVTEDGVVSHVTHG